MNPFYKRKSILGRTKFNTSIYLHIPETLQHLTMRLDLIPFVNHRVNVFIFFDIMAIMRINIMEQISILMSSLLFFFFF